MTLERIEERFEWMNHWLSNLAHTKVNNAFGGNMRTVTFDEFLYFKGLDHLVIDSSCFIPKMVHPLSKYWDQPYVSNVQLKGEYAEMTQHTCDSLKDYSTTYPSGAYEGKMWKRRRDKDSYFLCWYGKHENPELLSINSRIIKIVNANYLYMYDADRTLVVEDKVENFQYYVDLQKEQQKRLIRAKQLN